MGIAEALEVADRWRNERVIVVGNNALPYAVVKLADAYKSQAAELERLRADAERYRICLEDANERCRSAYQVAQRCGKNTDWWAFSEQVKESLGRQHAVMYPDAARGE